ncbi:hypothetical protein R5W24_002508 [Gemmata sp. JC717]|uniref:hypothetical protein n=1 Tax=Gemmata algarum TaxID=2975278 RepID=UPI0021BA5B79|nr:hypothetical protein [Gemmata algarum]MDY3553407.1 hypothetical protein [Gemmata algarum]
MPSPTTARPAQLCRVAVSALLVSAVVSSGCQPAFKVEPVTIRLERADQLLGAAHRHTIWINGQNVGMIRNGATNTFYFVPKIDEKNAIYIEAYDPFVKNPVSNTVMFNIGSGGEMTGTMKWDKNGTGLDLTLEVSIVNEGKYPPVKKK